jgi:hypothetical protein
MKKCINMKLSFLHVSTSSDSSQVPDILIAPWQNKNRHNSWALCSPETDSVINKPRKGNKESRSESTILAAMLSRPWSLYQVQG